MASVRRAQRPRSLRRTRRESHTGAGDAVASPGATQADLWQRAAAFAARAHRNQHRQDLATPYVSHLVRVALTTACVFRCDDPVVLAGALLHDTIEDTATDYDDIEEHFGREVADIVANLTQNTMLPESEREREYFARVAAGCWRTKVIKLADIYDNLCDVGTYPPEKRGEKQARFRGKGRRLLSLLTPADLACDPVARGAEALRGLVGV